MNSDIGIPWTPFKQTDKPPDICLFMNTFSTTARHSMMATDREGEESGGCCGGNQALYFIGAFAALLK